MSVMAETYFDLCLAYSVVWALIVAFLFTLHKKQSELSKRLDEQD